MSRRDNPSGNGGIVADQEKKLTVLVDSEIRLTPEMLSEWEFCLELGRRLQQQFGEISIRCSTIMSFICEFKWRGRTIAGLFTAGCDAGYCRAYDCINPDRGETIKRAEVWEKVFRPAMNCLVCSEENKLELLRKKVWESRT